MTAPAGGVMHPGVMDGRVWREPTTIVWMTAEDVSNLFGVSKMTVYRLIHREELPATRIGRSFRIRERDAKAYLQHNSTQVD